QLHHWIMKKKSESQNSSLYFMGNGQSDGFGPAKNIPLGDFLANLLQAGLHIANVDIFAPGLLALSRRLFRRHWKFRLRGVGCGGGGGGKKRRRRWSVGRDFLRLEL